jgi:hypothetical protein
MKKIIISLILISMIPAFLNGQKKEIPKNDPLGKWLFEAPYAPEGFTSGTIEVTFAEKKYNASMAFTGSGYSLPGNKVKFENDTLRFSIFIEEEDVAVILKFDDAIKMSGKAVYSQGEVPLLLTREIKKE